jgi:hypothetical protein
MEIKCFIKTKEDNSKTNNPEFDFNQKMNGDLFHKKGN